MAGRKKKLPTRPVRPEAPSVATFDRWAVVLESGDWLTVEADPARAAEVAGRLKGSRVEHWVYPVEAGGYLGTPRKVTT